MSITRRRHHRTALVAVPLLLVGVALNGCGVAEDQIRPGLAADVAGTEIEQSVVDDTVEGTCAYFDDAEASPTAARFPKVTVRRQILQVLVQEVAAQELVDELGVTVPEDYAGAAAQIGQNYADLPSSQSAAMTKGDQASTYISYASQAIGNALLREETGSEPVNPDLIFARGIAEIETWLGDHDVVLNPTYGLALDGGTFVSDTGLSVPQSTEAVAAQSIFDINLSDPDQDVTTLLSDATDTLPEDQICGPAAG